MPTYSHGQGQIYNTKWNRFRDCRAKTYAKANRKIVEIYVFFEGHYQIKLV